jgi:branched-chain amino acid transport system permease protein
LTVKSSKVQQPASRAAGDGPGDGRGTVLGKRIALGKHQAESSPATRARRIEAFVAAGAMIALSTLWMGDNAFRQDLVLLACVYSLIAIGMYIPLVLSGGLSIAYNAYFVIGAYTVAIWSMHLDVPIWFTVPIAMVASFVVAWIVGYATKGLSSYHLAVASLAVALAVDRVVIDLDEFTGGAQGVNEVPRPSILGDELSRIVLINAGLVLVWLLAVGTNRLRDSSWGLSMRLRRDTPLAADACGAPTEFIRLVGLGIGAVFATLAGTLLAWVNQFVVPDSFTFAAIFAVVFAPIVGGVATAWGCVVGAFSLMGIRQLDLGAEVSGDLIFGVAVTLILVAAPGGLVGVVRSAVRYARSLTLRVARRAA